MEYEDGYSISIPNPSGGTRWERIGSSYNNYVRIPIASESSKIDDSTSCWYLSIGSRGSGISKINNGTGSLIAHTDRKSIRPVITVKKVKKTT